MSSEGGAAVTFFAAGIPPTPVSAAPFRRSLRDVLLIFFLLHLFPRMPLGSRLQSTLGVDLWSKKLGRPIRRDVYRWHVRTRGGHGRRRQRNENNLKRFFAATAVVRFRESTKPMVSVQNSLQGGVL